MKFYFNFNIFTVTELIESVIQRWPAEQEVESPIPRTKPILRVLK